MRRHASLPKVVDLLATLTDYADLLRNLDRGEEAAKLEARLAEIRARARSKKSN